MIPHSKTSISDLELTRVTEVINSGLWAAGRMNTQFQDALASFLQREHVQLLSSGTSALWASLKALGIEKGDEVLVPAYICESVEKAIRNANGQPVFVDNGPEDWTSSFEEYQKKISPRTKAIIVNHTYGYRCNALDKLVDLGIPVIEDGCHALTTEIGTLPVHKKSLCSFFSFNATKLLAVGEGGAVATNDVAFHKEVLKWTLDKGLSDISCAIGVTQLERLPSFLESRKAIAQFYQAELGDICVKTGGAPSLFFRFPIWLQNPQMDLHNDKVAFRKGVDAVLGEQGHAPNASRTLKHTLSIPIYPDLTQMEMKTVIIETKQLYENNFQYKT